MKIIIKANSEIHSGTIAAAYRKTVATNSKDGYIGFNKSKTYKVEITVGRKIKTCEVIKL